jgi:hypothetical protein
MNPGDSNDKGQRLVQKTEQKKHDSQIRKDLGNGLR